MQKNRRDEKRKVQDAIYMSKREEAKQSKMIKSQNDAKKRHMHFKHEQENRMKNQIIKQQKHVANVKIEQDKNRRLYQVKKNIDEKVIDEDLKRAHKEEEVMQMEKLEMELIKKLQNTQAIQKDAY